MVERLSVVGVALRLEAGPVQLVVFAGSDWAGSEVTLRSSPRIVVKSGEHLFCCSRRL